MAAFLDLREGAATAEDEERAAQDAALEQLMQPGGQPAYDEIADSLPEALRAFGIHYDQESEFHQEHLAKLAKHLDGKLEELGDLSRQIGRLLAGAVSRGQPRALRGLSGHIEGLGRFER